MEQKGSDGGVGFCCLSSFVHMNETTCVTSALESLLLFWCCQSVLASNYSVVGKSGNNIIFNLRLPLPSTNN